MRKKIQSMIPDWTLLPEELLNLISENLDNCFDVVHARSVCRTWRSAFPFPSSLLRPLYLIPTFAKFPYVGKNLGFLEKINLFLFRVIRAPPAAVSSPSEFFIMGGIRQDKSKNHTKLPCPLQCSVKGKKMIPGSDQTLINMLECQILPLGYKYRRICRDLKDWKTRYLDVASLQLNKEGGGFVLLLNYKKRLLVLRSGEMRWTQLKRISDASCKEVVTFRGRFYATFSNGDIFVINPYSLEATPLMPVMHLMPPSSENYLVLSGNDELLSDELFLVEKFYPIPVTDLNRFTCRVSRLDEEAGKWVEVSELGDRVLFIGNLGNFSFSKRSGAER